MIKSKNAGNLVWKINIKKRPSSKIPKENKKNSKKNSKKIE